MRIFEKNGTIKLKVMKNRRIVIVILVSGLFVLALLVFIKRIGPDNGSSVPVNIGTIKPGDPSKEGLGSYPDLVLSAMPTSAVPVKFVVEHRSALDNKIITVRATIVDTLLGEKACPPNAGLCAQPSISLTDSDGSSRNKLYDLRILVDENTKEAQYPIGQQIEMKVLVYGTKVAVYGRKLD